MEIKKLHEICEAIHGKRRDIPEAVVDRMYTRHPELWQPYGQEGRELSLRDADYHITYLVEAISLNDPSLFAKYVEWLKGLFIGLRFPDFVLPTMLDTYQMVFEEMLPDEVSGAVYMYWDTARKQLQGKKSPILPHLDEKAPLYSLAKKYLESLLGRDRQTASRLILGAAEKGEDIKKIYLHVFQPCQYEIGRLWYLNKIGVAEEHYASAATQLIMSQLYPYILSTKKTGQKLVAACIADELHEIGIRMVADFFEMDGWDTYYIGSNAPGTAILQAVEKHEANVLALSITMPFHQKKLIQTIDAVRHSARAKNAKIMIGGYAVNSFPELWKRVGADGSAGNASEAVDLAYKLMTESEFKKK